MPERTAPGRSPRTREPYGRARQPGFRASVRRPGSTGSPWPSPSGLDYTARLTPGLLVVAGGAGCGLIESAVLDGDPAGGHVAELLPRLVEEVAGEVLRRGVDLVEGLQFIDHLVIEVLDDRAHDLLEQLE